MKMKFLDGLRELKKEGWKELPDNLAPNSKETLKRFDFCSYGIDIFYRDKKEKLWAWRHENVGKTKRATLKMLCS